MREKLIAYLLGHLDDRERRDLESRLASDDQLRAECEQLQKLLRVNPACPPEWEPPRGLADRTCDFCSTGATKDSRRSMTPVEPEAAHCGSWTWSEVAMAAFAMLAVALLIGPAILNSRYEARKLGCMSNVRNLGLLTSFYANHHEGYLPQVPYTGKKAFAGAILIDLVESGLADRESAESIRFCPGQNLARGSNKPAAPLPSSQEINQASGNRLYQMQVITLPDYASQIAATSFQGTPRPLKIEDMRRRPLFGDRPAAEGSVDCKGKRSGSHCGIGNVVGFGDGSAKFLKLSVCPGTDDNIYLNVVGLHSASFDPNDAVLLRGEASPGVHYVRLILFTYTGQTEFPALGQPVPRLMFLPWLASDQ